MEQPSWKAVIPTVLGTVLIAAQSFWSDGSYDKSEIVQTFIQGLTVVNVFMAANLALPLWKYTKILVAGSLAVLNLAAGWVIQGFEFTGPTVLNAVIAFAVAGGLLVTKQPAVDGTTVVTDVKPADIPTPPPLHS